MASPTFADLLEQIQSDQWRVDNPFSDDMVTCHQRLFADGASIAEQKAALTDWIVSQAQVCPFGRSAANMRRLTICLLSEEDLLLGDDNVRIKISRDRTSWRKAAAAGQSFGFLIVVVSEKLAYCEPSHSVYEIAKKLCSLYLIDSQPSVTIRDRIWLEVSEPPPLTHLEWHTSVGYFASHADGRWWKDRRIPGGIALSGNSVGHMTTTLMIQDPTKRADESLRKEKLVYFGLHFAMTTIRTAWLEAQPETNPTVYLPKALHGTELVSRREDEGERPYDPDEPRWALLKMYSENEYTGSYDTDATIPPYFFDENALEASRPLDLKLLFSYIHSKTDKDFRKFALGKLSEADQELFNNLSDQILGSH